MADYDLDSNRYTLTPDEIIFAIPDAPEAGPNAGVLGNALANVLTGNAGHNFLDGAEGADTLIGGEGNDAYVVDDLSDVITELADEGLDTVLAFVDFDLNDTENVENLWLHGAAVNGTGNDLNNEILGNDLANLLIGGGGNDTLYGGAGDTLRGGEGDDFYIIDEVPLDPAAIIVIDEAEGEGTDTVAASISFSLEDLAHVEHLTLGGPFGDLDGTGNALDNRITGNHGRNLLDGAAGADTLAGGKGNDTYRIDIADTIIELEDEGIDTVLITDLYAPDTYTLGEHLENIDLTGARAFTATGNAVANALTGNSGANRLMGLEGNDTLDGGAGDDRLEGGDGEDLLKGGSGADHLIGGAGNDLYFVDSAGDVVTEEATGGTFDRVIARVSYALGANLEYLALENGAGHISATGNGLDNTIFGNDGNNVIEGAAGRDQLYGATGNDILNGGDGDDTLNESGDGNDVLNGGNGADDLRAEGGNDTLDGGTGADILKGGAGNDLYLVDNAFDTLVEAAGEGSDTAIVSTTYGLAAGTAVETLKAVAGRVALNLSGNEMGNVIVGNAGKNKLAGMAGNDVLTGGKGKDLFVFNTKLDRKSNRDKITDFNVKDDGFQLDNAIFKKIGKGSELKPAKLKAAFFTIGKAKDKNDYILYNKKTGVLSYDPDGSRKAKAVDFAVVKKGLSLTADDFFVI